MECQICFAQESQQAPCCISYCCDCLIKWMEHQADIIKCPSQNCQNILTPDILDLMITDKQQKIQYHKVLLRKYLLKDQNTRACPSKCNYYGFIDRNQRCDKEIECMKCGYAWTEYSILQNRKKAKIEINNFVINSANALFDFWYTQECIVCNSKIQKNGGCPNMTCSICKTIFCWICKQNCSINHKQEICALQISIKIALCFYGLFTLINTLGYDSYFGFILYYIGYFALANMSVVLFFVSVFFGLKVHRDVFFGGQITFKKVKDYMQFTAALIGFFIVNSLMVDYFEKSLREQFNLYQWNSVFLLVQHFLFKHHLIISNGKLYCQYSAQYLDVDVLDTTMYRFLYSLLQKLVIKQENLSKKMNLWYYIFKHTCFWMFPFNI